MVHMRTLAAGGEEVPALSVFHVTLARSSSLALALCCEGLGPAQCLLEPVALEMEAKFDSLCDITLSRTCRVL